jgi:hypothetical protein
MQITRSTTAQQFIAGTQWQMGSGNQFGFGQAFDYFLCAVPLHVLNRDDTSSPWTATNNQRTVLESWLQAIDFTKPINPNRVIEANQRLIQFRFHGEPRSAKGNWYTWLSADVDKAGLPDGQTAVRLYRVTARVHCLETTVADAFSGWNPNPPKGRDYRHGGAKQLFIYRDGSAAAAVQLIGGS